MKGFLFVRLEIDCTQKWAVQIINQFVRHRIPENNQSHLTIPVFSSKNSI